MGVSDDAVRRVGLRRRQRNDPRRHQRQGQADQGARPFRPQRLRLHARSHDGRAAGCREIRSGGQLGNPRRHEDRPSASRRQVFDGEERTRRQHQGRLPGSARHQGRATGRVLSEEQPVLRPDQPCLHGLRAVQDRIHGGPAVCGRNAVDVSRAWRHPHGQPGGMGREQRQDRPVEAREVFRVERRADNRGRPGLLRDARGLLEVRRCQRHQQGPLQVQDTVRCDRQRVHL